MQVIRQGDDPFVCFGAKPNKGLSPRSRRNRKWIRERETSWTKELKEGVGEEWREWSVDTGQQKWPVGMTEGPEQWGKTDQDGLAFLVALWKFH